MVAGRQGMRSVEARLWRASNAMQRCLDRSVAWSDEETAVGRSLEEMTREAGRPPKRLLLRPRGWG